jgi:photosystem II stability/assembly factor-like uncharacterized protein
VLAGLAALALSVPAFAQQAPSNAPASLINEPTNPMLRGFRWRSIGPVAQGARVDDFAVDEKNPSTYYVGYAVSGVVKTTNNGTTFEPVFDTYGASSIADLALAPSDPNILYVATGEANNRQTTSYGDGLYKSSDAGKTFKKVGFENSQTLGRVVIHPKDPNTVWIAVGGDLYGPSDDKGVWMTTDGGANWKKTLFVDNNTAASDLAIDPSNPNHLFASMYQRSRTAWGFNGGGPGSGLYESMDGGRTWKKRTGDGLPRGTMGRIAMDFSRSNPNVIYAQIEVAADKEPAQPAAAPAQGGGRGGRGGGGARAAGFSAGSCGAVGNPNYQAPPTDAAKSGVWRSSNGGRTWTFVSNENQRPMYFSQIRVDPNNPDVVYLGGVGPTKSIDGGKTWCGENNMGHVDNHAIWIDPLNSKHVMYGNDGGIDATWDAGETWESVRNMPYGMGLAYHASVGMGRPYRVCVGLQDNGSWCGPSNARSGDGIRQWMWMSVGGGDGFQNAIDPTDENVFYTESQNAGIQRYDLTSGQSGSIKPNSGVGRGGAGGGRGGAGGGAGAAGIAQQGRGGGRSNVIDPLPTPMQFNWNNPILLSPHNSSTLLIGGRALHISRDRGQTWTTTKELGKNVNLDQRSIMGVSYALPECGNAPHGAACILSKHDGYVQNEFGTLTEIAESPIVPGTIWAGTDDGNVQLSRDGGTTWEEVGKNVPGVNHEYYVSGLEASYYDAGTAYLALDGHRNNDIKPYVFKTTDYGKTWTPISGNLPSRNVVNAIRQDPVNRNLLYAPTELGFFVSLDEGRTWDKFMPNLPMGRIDEVVVHPRDHDLVLSTHGRGVWILDDVTALEQLTPERRSGDAAVLPVRDAIQWKNDRSISAEVPGDKWWRGENAPTGTAIAFYLKNGGGDAKITITDLTTGQDVRTYTTPALAGLNRWQWNLCGNPVQGAGGGGFGGGRGFGGGCQGGQQAHAGPYRATVNVGGKDIGSDTFQVLEDVWMSK